MKKVMAGTLIAMVAVVGAAGSAAAQPDRGGRQDCRTYSSVKVCGTVQLNAEQQACARAMVQQGMTFRRAEVECLAFN